MNPKNADAQLEFPSIAFPRDRKVLRVAEVASMLDICDEQVFNLIECGRLQAINISAGRERAHWRIPVEAYRALLASGHSYNV